MKNKAHKALRRLKVKSPVILDRSEADKKIIDAVLKTLYHNADKDTLNLENDIYRPLRIKMPLREAERLWNVMTSTGLISPVIGFGNAGRIELTRSGYQLMSQYGSYADYLASQNNHQPQTVILPIQIEGDNGVDADGEEEHPLKSGEKKRAQNPET